MQIFFLVPNSITFDLNSENISFLRSWLRNEAITIYASVPSLFRCVFNSLAAEEQFSSLRIILLTGDKALKKDADLYKASVQVTVFLSIHMVPPRQDLFVITSSKKKLTLRMPFYQSATRFRIKTF